MCYHYLCVYVSMMCLCIYGFLKLEKLVKYNRYINMCVYDTIYISHLCVNTINVLSYCHNFKKLKRVNDWET